MSQKPLGGNVSGSGAAARLARVIETQRELAAAGGDMATVMRLIAERCEDLTGADGAMVSLLQGNEMLLTTAATGCCAEVLGAIRPLATSVAKHAVSNGRPLLIEDCETDPRINRELQRMVGDKSLICVPLFNGSRVIGSLNVLSRSETDRLTEADRETMEMLSVVLSAAMSHAGEFEAVSRFRALFEGASIGIMVLGPDECAAEANPAISAMLGRSRAALATTGFREYTHPDDVERSAALFEELMSGRSESHQAELRYCHADGGVLWAQHTAALERDADGRPVFVVAMIEDITQRKRTEEELLRQSELSRQQARHDALTGLPNRMRFAECVDQAIRSARRRKERVAVLMLDLDRFKEVNDSLGHQAGDALLQEVAQRIRLAVRDSDAVARLGGDEFGVLLTEVATEADIVTVIDRITQAHEEPILVQEMSLAVEASIGVALYPEHGTDMETLSQHADVAMYAAKLEHRPYAFYDPVEDRRDPPRHTLMAELHHAIADRQLELFYQPIAALATGEVEAVEALLRWRHPTRGWIYPDSFIHVARETEVIKPLTLYVLEAALRQAHAWRAEGVELTVAVNIATRNLLDVEFPGQVARLLERSGVAASALRLELTESTIFANPFRTKLVVGELAALGVTLSIDDFGTGYSSVAYLTHLPLSELKIDRSFVLRMLHTPSDATIVRSIIDLGRNLGVAVVADGVENAPTWERLKALGCTAAQGNHLSRPVPAGELRDWLLDKRRTGLEPATSSLGSSRSTS
jgi:diguanylate cyclase (GGDEF)-like protein/PAS domain S-box-containing protein